MTAAMSVWLLASSMAVNATGISERQKDQLKNLAFETRQKTDRGRDELMRTRMELARIYRAYGLDERKARAALEKVGKAQLMLLNLHLENQVAVRGILSEEQFSEFWRRMSGRMGDPGMAAMPPPEDAAMDRLPDVEMVRSLGLSPDQERRIRPLVGPGPQRMRVQERLRRESAQMIGLYSRYDLDEPAAKRLISSIHGSQTELSILNLKRQQELRAVLTEEQFERLVSEIDKRIRARTMKRPMRRP